VVTRLSAFAGDGKAWDRLLRRARRVPLQQSWGYGEAAAAYGAQVRRYLLQEQDQTIGALQCLDRRLLRCLHLNWLPRGPVMFIEDLQPSMDALQQLRAQSNPWRWRFFLAMPEWPALTLPEMRHAGFRQMVTPYNTIWIDLSRPIAEIQAGLHKKWRHSLTQAKASPLRVRELDSTDPHFWYLLQKESTQQQRIGYQGLPPMLISDYEDHAGEGSLLALAAYLPEEEAPVAGMIFLLHHGSATYQLGWNGPTGREHYAHHLLMWQALEHLQSRGVRWLDLGGVNTQASAGVARFKLGLRGELTTLVGTWL